MSNWLTDVGAVMSRNFSRLKRSPDVIGFALFQPIMFVLLFSQVYGGAIQVPGSNYTEFLMAGIFAQTVVFGATFSGTFMAQDLKEGGVIEQVIAEPDGGAQADPGALFAQVDKALQKNLEELCGMSAAQLREQRYEKFRRIGRGTEESA